MRWPTMGLHRAVTTNEQEQKSGKSDFFLGLLSDQRRDCGVKTERKKERKRQPSAKNLNLRILILR